MGKRKSETKSSTTLKKVKSFNSFMLSSGRVGKLHLIKTIHQPVIRKFAAIPWWLSGKFTNVDSSTYWSCKY